MIFHDFPDLFRYQFWHWFFIRFGIDVGSILEAFCHQIPCFGVIVFGNDFWCDLIKKGSLFLSRESVKAYTFSNLFRSWCFWKFLGSLCLLLAPFWLHVGIFGSRLDAFRQPLDIMLVTFFVILDNFVVNFGPSGTFSVLFWAPVHYRHPFL